MAQLSFPLLVISWLWHIKEKQTRYDLRIYKDTLLMHLYIWSGVVFFFNTSSDDTEIFSWHLYGMNTIYSAHSKHLTQTKQAKIKRHKIQNQRQNNHSHAHTLSAQKNVQYHMNFVYHAVTWSRFHGNAISGINRRIFPYNHVMLSPCSC